MPELQISKLEIARAAFLSIIAVLCMAQAPVPEPATDQETELGLAVYDELRAKGEIIQSSPLYASLRPVAEAISRRRPAMLIRSSSSWCTNRSQTLSAPEETSTSWIHCFIS